MFGARYSNLTACLSESVYVCECVVLPSSELVLYSGTILEYGRSLLTLLVGHQEEHLRSYVSKKTDKGRIYMNCLSSQFFVCLAQGQAVFLSKIIIYSDKFVVVCMVKVQPSMLWCCWLGVSKSIQSVRNDWWGAGVVICLVQGANDLHIVQLILLRLHHVIASLKFRMVYLSDAILHRLSWKGGC